MMGDHACIAFVSDAESEFVSPERFERTGYCDRCGAKVRVAYVHAETEELRPPNPERVPR